MAHRVAGVAEDQRRRRIVKAQQVDDRELGLLGEDADGAVLDVGMPARAAGNRDPQGIALVASRELR
jgi:hypothetical protein